MSINWEDSTTYQLIYNRGFSIGLQNVLLCVGLKKFGPPPSPAEYAIRALADPDQLLHLIDTIDTANGWGVIEELLQEGVADRSIIVELPTS